MKKSYLVLLIVSVLLFALGGCSTMSPVSSDMLKAAGVNVDHGVQVVADASVLKELAVHKTLQNRDTQIVLATKSAGFKATQIPCKRTVFYPGMKEPLTIDDKCFNFSYTPMPEFKQQLPTEQSVHPGYKMVENVVHDLAHATLVGYGISVAGNVLEAGFDQAGNDYSNATINQSYNNGDSGTNIGEIPYVEPDQSE